MKIQRKELLEATISLDSDEIDQLKKELYCLPKATKEFISELIGVGVSERLAKAPCKRKKGRGGRRNAPTRAELVKFVKDKLETINYETKTGLFGSGTSQMNAMARYCPNLLDEMVTNGEIYEYVRGKEVRGKKAIVYSLLKPDELPSELYLKGNGRN